MRPQIVLLFLVEYRAEFHRVTFVIVTQIAFTHVMTFNLKQIPGSRSNFEVAGLDGRDEVFIWLLQDLA